MKSIIEVVFTFALLTTKTGSSWMALMALKVGSNADQSDLEKSPDILPFATCIFYVKITTGCSTS